MFTFSDINSFILAKVANHAQITSSDVNTIMRIDNAEICEAFGWSRRTATTAINTVATYTTGTVTVTKDSSTVTGSSTVWTSAMAGRFIRVGTGNEYFKIAQVVSATSITLEVNYPMASASAQSYTIFQNTYPISPDIPVTYNTGSVTVTNNSKTVTGSGTTFTSSHEGLVFKVSGETRYYRINAYVGATELTLERVYEGITASGKSYGIYTRASDCEKIIFIGQTKEIKQHPEGRAYIDSIDPSRVSLASLPLYWIYAERGPCDQEQIELWPVPNANDSFRCTYSRRYDISFSADNYSIPLYPDQLLIMKGSASAAAFLKNKTGDRMWGDTETKYLQEFQALLEKAKEIDYGKSSIRKEVRSREDSSAYTNDYLVAHLPREEY